MTSILYHYEVFLNVMDQALDSVIINIAIVALQFNSVGDESGRPHFTSS